jgi:CRP-like cAMP-binding protein
MGVEATMYECLMELPLFQGMGRQDITKLVECAKLEFKKIPAGHKVVERDMPCEGFVFVIKGTVRQITEEENRYFALEETLQAPVLLQPEVLFGLSTRYSKTVVAHSDVSIMRLNKRDIIDKLIPIQVFQLNMMNLLSTRIQKLEISNLKRPYGCVEEKIIRLIRKTACKPSGEKVLRTKMEELAMVLEESRLNVSKALNNLQDRGLVELKRKEIVIPALERLIYEKDK